MNIPSFMRHHSDRLYLLDSSHHLLLLGATGLFGRHLLPLLLRHAVESKSPPKLTIVTRNKASVVQQLPLLARHCDFIELDFRSSAEIPGECAYTHILHMASTSAEDTFLGIDHYSKYQLLLNSAVAVRKLILAGTVERVVFASSGVAYGNSASYLESDNPELNHLLPFNSLAFGKLNAEFILNSSVTSSCILSIARCFSFVSPYLPVDIHYAVGNLVRDAVFGDDITVLSDGLDIRSYQHVDDAIDWILYLLTCDSPPPILNIGSDDAISIADLAERVKAIVNPRAKVKILNKPQLGHNSRRYNYVPNISLARSLGLSNSWSLDASLYQFSLHLRGLS